MSGFFISMPITSSKLHDLESRSTIVEIANGADPNQVVKPDIEDDQKRWLIVGICLHSVLSPVLRKYIPPVVSNLYSQLKRSDQIDNQKYPNQLARYKPTNKELNYEAINNNAVIPKVNRRKDEKNFNYDVKCDVNLSKLFMPTSMTQYTGFDDTCDTSALLGIIINIYTFPALVKTVAEQVRSEIRNCWAHCNFSEWDVLKFQDSFRLMHQFIRNLRLSTREETFALGELTKWQTYGIQFLHGTTLGMEIVKELKKELRTISKHVLAVAQHNDEAFENIQRALNDIQYAFEKSDEKYLSLKKQVETNYEQHKKETLASMKTMKDEIVEIKCQSKCSATSTSNCRNELEEVKTCVSEIRTEQQRENAEINSHVSDLNAKLGYCNTEINDVKQSMQDIYDHVSRSKKEIEAIKVHLSNDRLREKLFFYPPNRIASFVGRKEELRQLQERFFEKKYGCNMQILCGLGGIGKTTLSIEYAWNSHALYPGGVFWMSAETNESLEDSIQKIALDTDNVGNDAKESMRKTLIWLRGLQQRWLLVIDNLDMEEIKGNVKELVLGAWRHNSNGQTIITSRREANNAEEEFYVQADDCITLDILTEKESLHFITTRTGLQINNDKNAICLVHELGGLPLALEQAAAHIKALSCTYKEYFNKFKEQRLKLLKAIRPPFELSKERQAVRTTWQLNFDYILKQSEHEGLGNTAVTIVEILAYLYAEDIPFCVINTGTPKICDENLSQVLEDPLEKKQIIEILTRFSLCLKNAEVLSMHRLVQEVIREEVQNSERTHFILQCAIRMVNKALSEASSPNDAAKEENVGKISLHMWGKLALQANALRACMNQYAAQSPDNPDSCLNAESLKLLQTCAIYHSFYQRQDEALVCQNHMLGIITSSEISERDFHALTSIKIPILNRERLIIQCGITLDSNDEQSSNVIEDAEMLRQEGNTAYKELRFQDAIHYYSKAISLKPKRSNPKLFANRSITFLKVGSYENALRDAMSCIELDPRFWKAYCWKALALAGLVQNGILNKSWLSVGEAASSVAGFGNKQCLNIAEIKVEYPLVLYHIVDNVHEFRKLLNYPSQKTILLRKGKYSLLGATSSISKSVCLIGVENDVEIINADALVIRNPYAFLCNSIEDGVCTIDVYFENVCFPTDSGSMVVSLRANVACYNCRFSNGKKGCENFPICDGGTGCVNKNKTECKRNSETANDFNGHFSIGEVGYAGVIVCNQGKAFLDNCVFNRCGGGGLLCIQDNSFLEIRNSNICNNKHMGIEAREGGTVIVINCTIERNRTHGVNIGPSGYGIVWKCQIRGNEHEGIWCGGIIDFGENIFVKEMNHRAGSKCIIQDSMIYQNGMSGLSLEGGTYSICGNRIFDNWLWAVFAKCRSAIYISNNDIFENKCGGIRIGDNYSAPVTLDGNTIRDHNGPDICFENPINTIISESMKTSLGELNICIKDEVTVYNIPPFLTTRNIMNNNDRQTKKQCSQYKPNLETCCYCRALSGSLNICSNCRKASYCSIVCQKKHWTRHKHLCRLLYQKYTVEIDMANCTYYDSVDNINFKFTTVPLPDLGKGTPPDLTSTKKFIVKIQLHKEYTKYNPNLTLRLYDQTQKLDILFSNPTVYHFIVECGVLAETQITIKKLYCYASFKRKGKILCIHTETLPPYQHRW